jgi:prephenate dehydrogenase
MFCPKSALGRAAKRSSRMREAPKRISSGWPAKPGHPLAGKEKRGVAAADADLFRRRTFVLTPRAPAELKTAAAREFLSWIRKIGARPSFLSPAEHDQIVSLTSHLPQLASTALAATVGAGVTSDGQVKLSGPGLADTTRIALSSYDVWRDILRTNRREIGRALAAYIRRLQAIQKNLCSPNLRGEFERAADLARRVRRE